MKTKKPGPPKGQKRTEVKRSAFGERLYKIRRAKGLTQQELSERIGTTKRVIAFYEGNHRGPEPGLLQRMAAGLHVSISQLLGQSPLPTINDDLKPTLRKHLESLQGLPQKEQKTILHMIEIATEKNKQTRKIS